MAMLVISDILSSIFFILALYIFFLTTSFLLHHLVYLNQQEEVLIYLHLIFTLLLQLLKLLRTFFILSVPNISTLDFKLAKSTLFANFDLSRPAAFF